MEPIQIPIEDVLDLHTFRPQDIADLLNEYFSECIKAGIPSVRVIHGKGKGIQKKTGAQDLKKTPVGPKLQRCTPRGRRVGGYIGAVTAPLALTLTDLKKHPV